ncbi:alkylphosphonate utilization protein [Pseudohalocynthiibacter aestuariivivens]|jgi:protein PhnA|uniref:Alkylphosphonate utilization protein n=2 Tax=Pseudohalocynthiibacter TaxID=1759417 RepID=A0ABV5JBB2_9RHOB|nr:alkylphosphonate utilization protein [Pseudohalocynthiibacter aestuariivivens]
MSETSSVCEFCSASEALLGLAVEPRDESVTLCVTCREGMTGNISDAPHWKCLSDAIWSEVPAVQVLAYRQLKRLESEAWARDLLEIAYLDPELLEWAEAGLSTSRAGDLVHRDCNGVVLAAGDTVTLIKDLNVKGAGFTAKRGTAVRGISLVADNEGHIEGRVNGQRIVILTEFAKKSG